MEYDNDYFKNNFRKNLFSYKAVQTGLVNTIEYDVANIQRQLYVMADLAINSWLAFTVVGTDLAKMYMRTLADVQGLAYLEYKHRQTLESSED